MPLSGDLAGFGIEEVVGLLIAGHKSGRLILICDAVQSHVSFDDGNIIDAVHEATHGMAALRSVLETCRSGRFEFHDDEHDQESMRAGAADVAALLEQIRADAATVTPALPYEDEKLAVNLPSGRYPALAPLQWVILAELPRRCTLRHLKRNRDAAAVKRALVGLIRDGYVMRTGQVVPPSAGKVRLAVVKGDTREQEIVALDAEVVGQWRDAGLFTGNVSIAGHVFAATGRKGLGKTIILSAGACRLCGARDGQDVDVEPVV